MSERTNNPYVFGNPDSEQCVQNLTVAPDGKQYPFTICIEALHQSLTYAGVLEGYPNHDRNRFFIRKSVEFARKLFNFREPYVIVPIETAIELNDDNDVTTIFVLPAVCCIGSFTAAIPTKPGAGDYSMLTVVWFQDDWAFPIQDNILRALRALPWMDIALDCAY
jgi:hypothetical protein